MDKNSYPKFQIDITTPNRMYHVRCNDWEEFKKAAEDMEDFVMGKDYAFPKPQEELPKEDREDYCDFHQVPMKEREGKYGKFYSHGKKEGENFVWCTGEGWIEHK